MNVRLIHCLYVVVLLGFTSCITNDLSDCPVPAPKYVVEVSIEDKNYFNIADILELAPKDVNGAFRTFSETVRYTLTQVSTSDSMSDSGVVSISDNDPTFSIIFEGVPEGEYILTVWGNLTPECIPGLLNKDSEETTDTYMISGRLVFDSSYVTQRLNMKRVKGELLLLCTNFPSEVSVTDNNIDNIYEYVNEDFIYTGNTYVDKRMPYSSLSTTLLSPTVEGEISNLNINFFAGDNTTRAEDPYLTVPPIDLTISRNEISAIWLNYDTTDVAFEVSMFINGEWNMIHRLSVK